MYKFTTENGTSCRKKREFSVFKKGKVYTPDDVVPNWKQNRVLKVKVYAPRRVCVCACVLVSILLLGLRARANSQPDDCFFDYIFAFLFFLPFFFFLSYAVIVMLLYSLRWTIYHQTGIYCTHTHTHTRRKKKPPNIKRRLVSIRNTALSNWSNNNKHKFSRTSHYKYTHYILTHAHMYTDSYVCVYIYT